VVGVYRFWRDAGFALGALLAGLVADAAGAGTAIAIVAVLTAGSGLLVAATPWRSAAARPLLQEPWDTSAVLGRGRL
jgi:hypothetical protein